MQESLRPQNGPTTNCSLKSPGFEIEKIRESGMVLSRGLAKVTLCLKRLKPFELQLKRLRVIHLVFLPVIPTSRSHVAYWNHLVVPTGLEPVSLP